MRDETRSVRGKLEERRNESNIGCFGKTEGNMLQKETGLKCKNNIKGDFEEID